jgi:predicted metal-dependent HD superfamily phosphohydrolase
VKKSKTDPFVIALQSDVFESFEHFGISMEHANDLWDEVKTSYTEKGRYYHTMQHLVDMHQELKEVKTLISDFPSMIIALVYHDFIYRAKATDNEAQSASYAEKIMFECNIPYPVMKKVSTLIHATKNHQGITDMDGLFFLDADLAILGKNQDLYLEYAAAIRKEYKMYPDFLYKPGRRKVLTHFLEMERIFKSDHFYQKYEEQARKNLLFESIALS